MKLDLGCGSRTRPGYMGVDQSPVPGVVQVNLFTFPWPWEDCSISDIWCHHFFEHVPGLLRGQWMDELWRVLQPDGVAVITVPEWNSPGAVQDFTHEWPPVCSQSFMYFNRDARNLMGLDHYGIKCNFLYKSRMFVNVIPQMEVTLVKAP